MEYSRLEFLGDGHIVIWKFRNHRISKSPRRLHQKPPVFARKKPGKLGKIIGHSSLGKLGEQHTTIMQNVNREIVSSAPGKLVAQFKNCPFTRAATRFIDADATLGLSQ